MGVNDNLFLPKLMLGTMSQRNRRKTKQQ